jgi:hypothetical protein
MNKLTKKTKLILLAIIYLLFVGTYYSFYINDQYQNDLKDVNKFKAETNVLYKSLTSNIPMAEKQVYITDYCRSLFKDFVHENSIIDRFFEMEYLKISNTDFTGVCNSSSEDITGYDVKNLTESVSGILSTDYTILDHIKFTDNNYAYLIGVMILASSIVPLSYLKKWKTINYIKTSEYNQYIEMRLQTAKMIAKLTMIIVIIVPIFSFLSVNYRHLNDSRDIIRFYLPYIVFVILSAVSWIKINRYKLDLKKFTLDEGLTKNEYVNLEIINLHLIKNGINNVIGRIFVYSSIPMIIFVIWTTISILIRF